MPASKMLTMCGWRSFPASAASFWKKRSWRRAASGSEGSFSITFSATSLWRNGSAARYTVPVAPLPSTRLISYLPMRSSMSGGRHVAREAIVQVEQQRAVGPGIESLRHAAADIAAEERRTVGVALFEVLGDLPRVAHDALAVADHRHGLAA